METTEQNTLVGENKDENEAKQIKSMQSQTKKLKLNCKCKFSLIFCAIIALFCIAGLIIYFKSFINTRETENNNPNELDSYVLPNASISINILNNNTVQGSFIVKIGDKSINIAFESETNESYTSIEFMCDNECENKDNWIGFNVHKNINDYELFYELYNKDTGKHVIIFKKDVQQSENDIKLMESFLNDIIIEYYVLLSFKLASLGYVGNETFYRHLHEIHGEALLLRKIADIDNNVDLSQWVDLTNEIEKINTIIAASKRAGYWITTMSDLLKYTSNEYSNNTDDGFNRRRLGNCGRPSYRCGNRCFGMCGFDCTCISLWCGDCDCWRGCYNHDYYCSCQSFWSYCCLNVFWMDCDDGGGC